MTRNDALPIPAAGSMTVPDEVTAAVRRGSGGPLASAGGAVIDSASSAQAGPANAAHARNARRRKTRWQRKSMGAYLSIAYSAVSGRSGAGKRMSAVTPHLYTRTVPSPLKCP